MAAPQDYYEGTSNLIDVHSIHTITLFTSTPLDCGRGQGSFTTSCVPPKTACKESLIEHLDLFVKL
jgi:hypothetical protein